MKRLRSLVIATSVAAALLLLAIGGGAWLLGSERGAEWLVATALSRAGPTLTVGRVGGTLRGELTLGDVTLLVNGDRMTVAELRLTLDLVQVLRGALVVDELRSTRVSYVRAGVGSPPAQGAGRSLPLAVEIRRALVDGIAIESGEDRLAFDATSFAAAAAGNEIVIENIETQSRDVRMAGRAEVGIGPRPRVAAQVDWSTERDGQPLSGRLIVDGTLPELDVSHELFAPFDVTAAGKLWVEDTPRIDVVVRWRDVAIPGRDDLRSSAGSAELAGEITALQYSSTGAIALYGREFDYSAAGTVDGAVLTFAPLSLTGAGGVLSADGEIALDSLQWNVTLAARAFDPGAYAADWPGRIDVDAALRGRLEPALQVRADSISVSGIVREYPFTATGSGSFEAPAQLQIDALDVAADEDTLHLRGTIGERLDLALTADVDGFERLWPELSGSLVGDVRVAGTLQEPQISGRLEAREIALGEYAVSSASLEGSVTADPAGAAQLDLSAANLRLNGLAVESLRASFAGTSRAHELRAEASAELWSATLAAHGGLEDRLWRGSVDAVRADQAALGQWRLGAPARIEAGRDRVLLDTACLSQSGADLCASIRVAGRDDDEIVLSARNFALEALQPVLPDTVILRGVYQLAATIQNPGGVPRARVALTGGPTQLRVELGPSQVIDTSVDSVIVGGDLGGGRLDLRVDVNGGDAGRVNLRTTIDDVSDPGSPVDGQLDLSWRDLSVLALLSPDLGSVAGVVAMQLELGGTVAEPQLSGRAQLNDAAVEFPALGLLIDDIESTAVTVDGRTLEYSGTGAVDGQQLRLQGSTELDPERNFPTRLSLQGEALPLVQRADAEVFVSPDLDVEVILPDIAFTGTLHVPRAVIALDQVPAQAERPSADSVVHGVGEAAPVRPLRTRADVRVTLGENVRYNGSNLLSVLDGELRLLYESGRMPTASGSLSITGVYNAYGQPLQLERGELRFTGPLDDPTIDVRAEREIGETTVGVQLTGTLKAPVTRIYSDPVLSEADALAYLLLGRPLSGTGEQETATLESAALSMGLQQALPVVQRIGTSLGLDELSIQTTDVDAGALMAGKYLSPKLYVRYSYGLFNRIGGWLVRFRFNERLSIETRSGDERSMDLLYTVEKD